MTRTTPTRLDVIEIGSAVRLDYIPARGSVYRHHNFPAAHRPTLYMTPDRRHLVIAPVRLDERNEIRNPPNPRTRLASRPRKSARPRKPARPRGARRGRR